ncbi:MAG: hypothetical protein J1E34_10040 [Oscillospiraceae bacterium]|nr:hypothetical protein [Oscillospiraceae bacterium]
MDSILNISEADILAFIENILNVFKQIMAWLGILVLPEKKDEGETADPDAE